MLSFEEFFQKKKIDLVLFQALEPDLFSEFSLHYPLMGEKSFDHTKKYWFNKLRRNYPLAAEVKSHAVKAEAISAMAIQGMAVAAAQNLDTTLEKPKFTEDHLAELVEENVSIKEVSLAEEEKIITDSEAETPVAKPAFKPRFNAKNIKKTDDILENIEDKKSEESEPAIETPKPAFKPRFKMQNIKKDSAENQSISNPDSSEKKDELNGSNLLSEEPTAEIPQPETTLAKPAFKPRFNMQNLKKSEAKEVSVAEDKTPATEIENEPAENVQPETAPIKPAFKPRFNMQNMKKSEVKEALENENDIAEPTPKNPEPAIEQAENKEAKPAYKPRFQMKNMPKPAAENPPPAED